MTLTESIIHILFKHLEPLTEARWTRGKFLLDAGFLAGSIKGQFEDEEVIRNGSEEELQMIKAHQIGQIKYMMGRFIGITYTSQQQQNITTNLEQIEANRKTAGGVHYEQEKLKHQDRERQAYKKLHNQFACEVAQFATDLSQCFVANDTLQNRVAIIRKLIEQELGERGFKFDKKLSSIKNIVYCKPLFGGFNLFVATNRSQIKPSSLNNKWELDFCFGIHCMEQIWPGDHWNHHKNRWSFLIQWFYPIDIFGNIYHSFTSLPELELSVRFHLFAYKLVADEFESALRAGFAEAEEAGLLASDDNRDTP